MRVDKARFRQDGFTLASVLEVMAAMLLMAVGVLAVMGIERKTARSYVDAKRAEWIARAGMEDVRGLLRSETANDEYLIVSKPGEQTSSDKKPLDYLFLARGDGGGDQVDWTVFPLFSSENPLATGSDLNATIDPAGFVDNGGEEIEPLPWADPARLAWVPVEDEDGRMVGRYAFWVEDMQGKISGRVTQGMDEDDLGKRANWPFPAPGVSEDEDVSGPEVALHVLDPNVTEDVDTSDIDERLNAAQKMLVSPDSVLAAMDFKAPLERDPLTGDLVDEEARNLEENVAADIYSYYERPMVPHTPGISEDVAGLPKLNLNRLLNDDRSSAIEEFSTWVDRALPEFEKRKGAFPDDYLKTLAANVFDYADVDNDASVSDGEYRGLDSYPVVSEYAIKFRWEDFQTIDDQKHFILTGAVYVELWNMSDQVANGTVQVSYGTHYNLDLSLLAGIDLGADDILSDPDIMVVPLPEEDGAHWLPPVVLDPPLEPNEYRVIKAGEVSYRFPASYIPSPIELYGEESGVAGYKMRWNGRLVDQARGEIVRRAMTVHYPTSGQPETKTRPRQRIATCIPGHSYSPASFTYANNMGDPRMSFYINIPMSPNKYGNFSPHRRTVRWSTIYDDDSATKPKVYGRVLPSEWPDGGHNSKFGSVPAAIRSNGDEGDERIDPDDPEWLSGLTDPVREEAPMRISNRGLFYSACEMGRAYDPLMWEPTYENSGDTTRIRSGVMPTGETSWPAVTIDSPPSEYHGGGNTLRIGRAEHPKFELPDEDDDDLEPGLHAAHLLDLFHVGNPKLDEEAREGELVLMKDRVNLNTATKDAIRVLVAGNLAQDPMLSRQVTKNHLKGDRLFAPTALIDLGAPARDRAGDLIAEAIMQRRPFTSAAELASVEDESGEKVFGNREMYALGDKIEWSDSAAEELFARIYESSTFRSRNFRIWVVGQAVAPLAKGSSAEPTVLAESRKVFSLFANPETRTNDGEIDSASYEPEVIHENDF